jgi:hypothetical protein
VKKPSAFFIFFVPLGVSWVVGMHLADCSHSIAAHTLSEKWKRNALAGVCAKRKGFKAPSESRFHLSTLDIANAAQRCSSLSQLAFHLSQTPKIDPVSVGASQEFKYSEDGAMINPPAVHGAVLSSFHLLGGALFHWFILQTWPSMAWFYDAGGMRRAPLCNACEIKWERKKITAPLDIIFNAKRSRGGGEHQSFWDIRYIHVRDNPLFLLQRKGCYTLLGALVILIYGAQLKNGACFPIAAVISCKQPHLEANNRPGERVNKTDGVTPKRSTDPPQGRPPTLPYSPDRLVIMMTFSLHPDCLLSSCWCCGAASLWRTEGKQMS